jgi:hypothetical protein
MKTVTYSEKKGNISVTNIVQSKIREGMKIAFKNVTSNAQSVRFSFSNNIFGSKYEN